MTEPSTPTEDVWPGILKLDRSYIESMIAELETQNDRSAAIVGTTLLEEYIRKAIKSDWPPISKTMEERLFEGYGPLASFKAKVDIAASMGLLSKSDRTSSHLVRAIRNRAAHVGFPFSFEDAKIKKFVDQIPLDRPDMNEWMTYLKHPEWASESRKIFLATVSVIGLAIHITCISRFESGRHIKPIDFRT